MMETMECNAFSSWRMIPRMHVIEGYVFVDQLNKIVYMHYVTLIMYYSEQGFRDEAFDLLAQYIKLKYCA